MRMIDLAASLGLVAEQKQRRHSYEYQAIAAGQLADLLANQQALTLAGQADGVAASAALQQAELQAQAQLSYLNMQGRGSYEPIYTTVPDTLPGTLKGLRDLAAEIGEKLEASYQKAADHD